MSYSDQVESIPLIVSENGTNTQTPKESRSSRPIPSSSNPFSTLLIYSALVGSFLSLLWNGLNAFSTSRHPLSITKENENAELDTLRRPSLYLGLDRVPKIYASRVIHSLLSGGNPSHGHTSMSAQLEPYVGAIAGRPSGIARISSQFPYSRFPQDGWVLLTENDRTLLEFQPLSTSPARCMLASYFPLRKDLEDKLLTIELDDVSSRSPSIQLRSAWSQEGAFNLSMATWNSRPLTEKVLGSLSASFGQNSTSDVFDCPVGYYPLLVEMSCVGRGCRVEYKEESGVPLLGIELVQV